MKVGKISESVLKRSVLKQLKSKNTQVKNGAGVGADCAIFSCGDALTATCIQAAVVPVPTEIRYLIHKAANGVACGKAVPVLAQMTLLLPPDAEEDILKQYISAAEETARELGIQIAGGHTEVTEAVNHPCVTVQVTGTLSGTVLKPGGANPGQDIVVSKWVGLEGSAKLADAYADKLSTRYPYHMIAEAASFKKYLSIIPEAATAIKSNVGAMHDVSGGGIFAALWELAESAGVGLTVDLKKIPVRQETIEVCEFFGISPYELLSGGALLMTTDDGEELVHSLAEVQIPATVIGKITANNDRVVINEDEKRFLERPKSDEITKIE